MVKRPPAKEIPDHPGVYLFRDGEGRVLYVGKAKSLRKRVSSYFGSRSALATRTLKMLHAATSVEWLLASNEVEAILLENNLIKAELPEFNILMKDDKSYPYLAVTASEQWPRAMVTRGNKRKGARYFGPYAHAHAIRETLDLLLRTFPLRTCSDSRLAQHEALARPCLYWHIERCAGPCVGKVSAAEYARLVEELCKFLDGEQAPVVERLEFEMREAAAVLEFERAARKRDELDHVSKVVEKQRVISSSEESFDAVAVSSDELEASVQVFMVRRGRLTGRKGMVVENAEELDRAELLGVLLERLYSGASAGGGRSVREPTRPGPPGRKEPGTGAPAEIPRLVVVEDEPADVRLIEAYLSELRGGPVSVRVPKRGDKRALLETVAQNASEAFVLHRMRRASDHNARSRALQALQDALGLPEAPLRIECFDISNTGGTEIVGSMVVFEDGLPKPKEYRRFKIRGQSAPDDFAAMAEVLRRRFAGYMRDTTPPKRMPGDERPAGEARQLRDDPHLRDEAPSRGARPNKFGYRPGLVIVDGGEGQVTAGMAVLDELGLEEIPLAGLAKRFEEVYLPADPHPLRIERGSEALYLLQRVRDEAHRFAVEYHRKLRGKRMFASELDGIRGLGESRKKALLKGMGSLKRIREASLEDLQSVKGLPAGVAETVYERLHAGGAGDRDVNRAADRDPARRAQ